MRATPIASSGDWVAPTLEGAIASGQRAAAEPCGDFGVADAMDVRAESRIAAHGHAGSPTVACPPLGRQPGISTGGLGFAMDERPEPDPVVRAYLAGVERTLIAKNLALTPEERLRQLMALQEMASELRRAGREASGR